MPVKRETRPSYRPEACRVHFAGLKLCTRQYYARRDNRGKRLMPCAQLASMGQHPVYIWPVSRCWAFVDESKSKKYILVASLLEVGDLVQSRRSLSRLLIGGQSRIHFKNESPSRRRKFLSIASSLPHKNLAVVSHYSKDKVARAQCLEKLMLHLLDLGVEHVVFEWDESILQAERKFLTRFLNELNATSRISFEHRQPRLEQCLWLPDAVAWCIQRGGEWVQRVVYCEIS